jgi:uncharacterized protein YqjF (DUF2071 family)
MDWEDLLFAHWPVDPQALERLLPRTDPPLELDLREGVGWIGVVPFRMSRVHPRCLPLIPGTHTFPELNVRTYVRVGGLPGVWFFSLDATSRLAVRVARWTYHLPYFDADIRVGTESGSGTTRYQSQRTHRGGGQAQLDVTYSPVGTPQRSTPGSLESWLTERYRLFAANRRGHIWRGEIHHEPWSLQPALAEFNTLNMTRWLGLDLPGKPPHLLYSRHLSVHAEALVRC